jgi:multicomponent Na+:H+ antiporter subunit E
MDRRYMLERARTGLIRAAFLALLWWALTEGSPAAWAFGVPVIALAVGASMVLHPRRDWSLRPFGLARFIGFFLWQSLRGGIDVAGRALHPRLPIAPAMVDYRLRLPEGPARVFLADVVSLLPGTLSAALSDGRLRLHVLDERMPVTRALGTVEERVAALFGLTL